MEVGLMTGRVLFFFLISLIAGSLAEYVVLHSPSYVEFLPTDATLQTHELPNLIVSSFGFATNEDLKWPGLAAGNPFKKPKAHVLFSAAVPSNVHIHFDKVSQRYKSANDVGDFSTRNVGDYLQSVSDSSLFVFDETDDSGLNRLKEMYPWLFLGLPTTFQGFPELLRTKYTDLGSSVLNTDSQENMKFLAGLFAAREITNMLKSNSRVIQSSAPSFLHFHLRGLPELEAKYGPGSEQVTAAVKLLEQVTQELAEVFTTLYDGNVVVEALMYQPLPVDQSSQQMRQLLQEKPAPDDKATNNTIAEKIHAYDPWYSDNISWVFNVVFWGSVILLLALLAISYSIWYMDPGRDSIIYRMTSQRMKKDQ